MSETAEMVIEKAEEDEFEMGKDVRTFCSTRLTRTCKSL